MDNKVRVADKALIQVILQEYRDRSVDSITGPTAIRKYEEATGRHRVWPGFSSDILKGQPDHVSSRRELDSASSFTTARLLAPSGVAAVRKKTSKVKRTLLDGIPIACFNIGGEKRLCFEQLRSDVLREFNSSEVNTSRDHLKIYCPKCDEDQLESLKLSKTIAWTDSSSLLITKSDAYRLCSALLANKAPQRHDKKYTKPYIDVYHECFGGCEGIFEPEIYTEPHAKCVTCLECYRMYSPRKFVTHTHATMEIQTCHWGMDSSKWRDYMLLPDDKAEDEFIKKLWENVKKRFFGTIRKRKLSNSEAESVAESECSESSARKRSALNYAVSPIGEPSKVTSSSSVSSPKENQENSKRSAFRPWSPLEDRNRETLTTSTCDQNKQTSSNDGHFVEPNCSVVKAVPYSVHTAAQPIQPTYVDGNYPCALPAVPFPNVNGYPSNITPVKSEYPIAICSQAQGDDSHSPVEKSRVNEEERILKLQLIQHDFASPERVKQVLSKYCHRGHLPSVDELSFALANELRDWSYGQSKILDDLKEKGDKLREEMNSLCRDNTAKLDSACEELTYCQENLDRLNRKRDEDFKEFKKTREALQRQVERLQEQRSSESEKIKRLMNQLNERDTRCRILEKELDYIRSWYVTGSQTKYTPFQTLPVAVYGGTGLREMYHGQNAVIQEMPVFTRNGEKSSSAHRNHANAVERDTNSEPNGKNEPKEESENHD